MKKVFMSSSMLKPMMIGVLIAAVLNVLLGILFAALIYAGTIDLLYMKYLAGGTRIICVFTSGLISKIFSEEKKNFGAILGGVGYIILSIVASLLFIDAPMENVGINVICSVVGLGLSIILFNPSNKSRKHNRYKTKFR